MDNKNGENYIDLKFISTIIEREINNSLIDDGK